MDSASGSKEERLNKNLAFKLSELSWALLGMVLTSLCGGLAGFLLECSVEMSGFSLSSGRVVTWLARLLNWGVCVARVKHK